MEPTTELRQAIREYRSGKAEAFNRIYEDSSRYLYTCIYKVMSGNDNAQDAVCDIMQDTYVEISRNIAQLDDENRFLAWAGTIATRKCYARLKKDKKYVLLHEEDDTFENLADDDNIIPEDIMQDREKQRLVREIIDTQLTQMQKLCIIAYYYNEQKQSEIAQELGIPENTVKTNLSRAKAKIKENVLELEKKQGTRLYSVAPLLVLLFREEVLACTVPREVTEGVAAAVSATGVGRIIRKITEASAKTKIVTLAAAVGIAGGTAFLWNENQKADSAVAEYVLQLREEESAQTAWQLQEEESQTAWPFQNNESVQNTNVPDTDAAGTDIPGEAAAWESFEGGGFRREREWQSVYEEFLLGLAHGEYEGFDLHDLDGDGIPEILLKNTEVSRSVDIYSFYSLTSEVKTFSAYRFGIDSSMGYGSTATEFIYLSYKDEDYQPYNPKDVLAYRMIDSEIVETVRLAISWSGEDVYAEIETNRSPVEVTYEQAMQRIEELEEIYQPIDYKLFDEQTIKSAMSMYRQ